MQLPIPTSIEAWKESFEQGYVAKGLGGQLRVLLVFVFARDIARMQPKSDKQQEEGGALPPVYQHGKVVPGKPAQGALGIQAVRVFGKITAQGLQFAELIRD